LIAPDIALADLLLAVAVLRRTIAARSSHARLFLSSYFSSAFTFFPSAFFLSRSNSFMEHLHDMVLEDEILLCSLVLLIGMASGAVGRLVYSLTKRSDA
jgi:hypothetical protein